MKRRGYTLVELVVVVSLLSMLSGIAAVVLTSVISHLGRQRNDDQAIVVVRRLAADFRRDAHTATLAQIEDLPAHSAGKITMTSVDGETITYAVVADGIERIATGNQETVQRELYRLPRAQHVHFAREILSPGRAIVVCNWQQSPPGVPSNQTETAPQRDNRLEAALTNEAPQ